MADTMAPLDKTVDIALRPNGYSSRVEIDGADLSAGLVALDIRANLGETKLFAYGRDGSRRTYIVDLTISGHATELYEEFVPPDESNVAT